MQALTTVSADTFHDLMDFNVVDRQQDSIGSLHAMWNDATTGQLEFLGVKTGWLFGSTHVVPADGAQIDTAARLVQVNYDAAFVKDAPSIAADVEITDEQEAEIYRYYNTDGNVARRTTETFHEETAGAGTVATAADRRTETDVTTPVTTTAAATAADRDARTGETIEVALQEEKLKVGKREVETGAVRLRKVIRTEQVQVPVELRTEDVVVERVAAADVRPGDIAAADFNEKNIDITLHREEPVIAKETVVTGAVRVRKTEETETQTVSDTVRSEDVEVDRSGARTTAGTEVRRGDDDADDNDNTTRR